MQDKHLKFSSVTLWHFEGKGVRVSSQMQDVAEKLEVGVLSFGFVDRILPNETVVEANPIFLPQRGSKLQICEAGISLESGLDLSFDRGRELRIVPAAFPFFLAVSGTGVPAGESVPEYPLENYALLEIFGADSHQGS